MRPAATSASRSVFRFARSASSSPLADFPWAVATSASDLPAWSCVRNSSVVSPRYVAAAESGPRCESLLDTADDVLPFALLPL